MQCYEKRINYKEKPEEKTKNMWRLNNMLLKTQWFAEVIKEEIKNPRDNENESMMTQNLWDAAKAILRGKFIQILATKLGKKKLS